MQLIIRGDNTSLRQLRDAIQGSVAPYIYGVRGAFYYSCMEESNTGPSVLVLNSAKQGRGAEQEQFITVLATQMPSVKFERNN